MPLLTTTPGTSNQKQMFIPRSVSTSEGVSERRLQPQSHLAV